MENEKEKWYLEKRLNDQINWYDKKSIWNQKWFKRLKWGEIILASLLPITTVINLLFPQYFSDSYYKAFVIIDGILLGIASTIQELYGFHKNWIQYRTTAETLKHEKYLYLAKCQPYDGEDAFCKLVSRVESIISKENSQWQRIVKKSDIRPNIKEGGT